MHAKMTLSMVDGTRIVAPDTLDLMTPYVLREQQDWFEDEIKFLRRILRPGQTAVDIGANHGVYSLSIATTVGATGHVWSFEPAAATAAMLSDSVAVNGFANVTLEQCALSGEEGTAQLSMHGHSELNAIVRDGQPAQATESVRTVTLDGCAEKYGWRDIDFIKIDAEGEEINILRGGEKFFATHTPLVQYEIMAGKDLHLELVQAFADLGYSSYRLIPGLDLLAPFDTGRLVDPAQLNLFACKPDRAERLEADGWLVRTAETLDPLHDLPAGVSRELLAGHAFDWRVALATLPYGQPLAAQWERGMSADETDMIEDALALFALSRDSARPPGQRLAAIECSFFRFRHQTDQSPVQTNLASLARVAQDFGARFVAIDLLTQLCRSILEKNSVDVGLPFLAPGVRFDTVDPQGKYADWLFSAADQELERQKAFSSFFVGAKAKDRLEYICRSEFAQPEMHRRLALVRQRFNLPAS